VKRTILALLGFTVTAAVVLAQAPSAPPRPAPEVKSLEYFVGKWSVESDIQPGLFGPGGKYKGTESWEPFTGGFHVVGETEGKGPKGEVKGHGVMAYDAESKAYVYQGIDSTGWTGSGKGSLSGDTWTWSSEAKVDGKPMKMRTIIKQVSKDAYTWKSEASPDGQAWKLVEEGKGTRVK
jgi:hypothetical protein